MNQRPSMDLRIPGAVVDQIGDKSVTIAEINGMIQDLRKANLEASIKRSQEQLAALNEVKP